MNLNTDDNTQLISEGQLTRYLPAVALIEGIPDEQKTSPVRRTFCLMVLFDLFGIFLFWILDCGLSSNSLHDAMYNQVICYDFRSSMFDVVVLGFWRFAVLEFFYALLRSSRPWWVAVCTTGTGGSVIIKIFFFDFQHRYSPQPSRGSDVFVYFMLISSVVLSWVETFFLDFCVLPKEKAANSFLHEVSKTPTNSLYNNHLTYNTSVSTMQTLRHHHSTTYNDITSAYSVSERFFSPRSTTTHSVLDEREYCGLSAEPQYQIIAPEIMVMSEATKRYMQRAETVFALSYETYADRSNWHHEAGDPIRGCVYSKKSRSGVKVFKLEGFLDVQPQVLYQNLIDGVEEAPTWNPSIVYAKRVEILPNNADIVYNISSDALGGAISARDFVTVRKWGVSQPSHEGGVGVWFLASGHVEHPECPVNKKYVRGENHPGCLVCESVEGDDQHCKFVWIVNSDIKGWIPQSLIDKALNGVLLEFLSHLSKHIKSTLIPSLRDVVHNGRQ